MICGVTANLLLLIFFKYKHLLIPKSVFIGSLGGDPFFLEIYNIALPVGISFYTFHGMSLIIDSYHSPETLAASHRNPLIHCFKTMHYISFFPQIVAGPIAKGKFFYPQIIAKRFADINWPDALRALVQGYFLKEVVANNLNQLTEVMVKPELWSKTPSAELALMIPAYSAQIFADFAGYSLMSIGLARLFGYELPINFRQPYLADSFTDFWRRWHISLSSWLKDYLYIPLGGNRRGNARKLFNLMTVMFLGGLWHGAAWKFATWGLFHGVALAVEQIARSFIQTRLPKRLNTLPALRILRILLVFVFVSIAWLFFRLNTVADVVQFMSCIVDWKPVAGRFSESNIILSLILCSIVVVQHIVCETSKLNYHKYIMKIDPYLTGALAAITLVAKGKESAFIYFQF